MNISARELSEVIGMNPNTIASWLNGWRFAKFRLSNPEGTQPRVIYEFTDDFKKTFIGFLELRRQLKAAQKLEKFNKIIIENTF